MWTMILYLKAKSFYPALLFHDTGAWVLGNGFSIGTWALGFDM